MESVERPTVSAGSQFGELECDLSGGGSPDRIERIQGDEVYAPRKSVERRPPGPAIALSRQVEGERREGDEAESQRPGPIRLPS